MVIMGIDPGTATTGFGIIKSDSENLKVLDYGCIATKANIKLADRLAQISTDLGEIIQDWQPDHIAIEELFFSKNVKTAMHVAHARGAIMQKLSERGKQIFEYKPQQIKEAVCGYGRADKNQVQKMVKFILQMDQIPKPDDAADALGVAICHHSRLKYNSLTSS